MATRAEQREDTCERIVAAAIVAFSELGFHGASTRDIAARAGTTQGLITYHFRTKEELWRAAAEQLFGLLRSSLVDRRRGIDVEDPRERAREGIREYVRFVAKHPELLRFMMEAGAQRSTRGDWLVTTHLVPFYQGFCKAAGALINQSDSNLQPHAFYAMAGAASLLFAVPAEARRLTGADPTRKQTIETHADYIARLMVP